MVLRDIAKGVLVLRTLAIAASERNLGYGAEAVYALEERYRSKRSSPGCR